MPEYASQMDDIMDAMSIKYNNQVYGLKQAGHDVITLSYGEAYFDIPLFEFSDLPFPSLYHYSHSRGIPGLRTKLCNYYRERYGVGVDPASEIVVTAGSKIAIYMALAAILNPGDEVLLPEPTWVSYSEHAKLRNATPVFVPHSVDISEIEKYITPKTKVIVICNPNNPSGHRLNEQQMKSLHALAEKHNLFILSDEAYSDYFLNQKDFISIGVHDPEKKHTIICNSMSKNFGMSGWRLGYVITNPKVLEQILKINQHLVTCPSTILEMYLEKHFDEIIAITESQIKGVVEKRQAVLKQMDELQLKYMPGDTTFYIFVSIESSQLDSESFCDKLLEEKKVSTVPGIGYGQSCDKYIRISVGNEPIERIVKGLTSIREMIDATSSGATLLSNVEMATPV